MVKGHHSGVRSTPLKERNQLKDGSKEGERESQSCQGAEEKMREIDEKEMQWRRDENIAAVMQGLWRWRPSSITACLCLGWCGS